MPKCSDCGTYYDRHYMTCPVCRERPNPAHKHVVENFSFASVGDTYAGQTIVGVHLHGDCSLTLDLADGSRVDFADYHDLQPVECEVPVPVAVQFVEMVRNASVSSPLPSNLALTEINSASGA